MSITYSSSFAQLLELPESPAKWAVVSIVLLVLVSVLSVTITSIIRVVEYTAIGIWRRHKNWHLILEAISFHNQMRRSHQHISLEQWVYLSSAYDLRFKEESRLTYSDRRWLDAIAAIDRAVTVPQHRPYSKFTCDETNDDQPRVLTHADQLASPNGEFAAVAEPPPPELQLVPKDETETRTSLQGMLL